MAAQLIATKGRSRRGESWWMARAKSSFPVPDSPCSKTVESVGATRWIALDTSTIRGESPMIAGRR